LPDLQAQQGTRLAANSTAAVPPGTLCIDLVEFLGLHQFLAGITWEPKVSVVWKLVGHAHLSCLDLHRHVDCHRRKQAVQKRSELPGVGSTRKVVDLFNSIEI
jgi:hypothetical protein